MLSSCLHDLRTKLKKIEGLNVSIVSDTKEQIDRLEVKENNELLFSLDENHIIIIKTAPHITNHITLQYLYEVTFNIEDNLLLFTSSSNKEPFLAMKLPN